MKTYTDAELDRLIGQLKPYTPPPPPLCPVCRTPMKTWDYYNGDIHMTEECGEVCPNHCYFYQFAYGASAIGFYGEGDAGPSPYAFAWNYDAPVEEYQRQKLMADAMTNSVRRLMFE